jgi:hypothetical protein
MAAAKTVYCYMWIKVTDKDGQLKDDQASLAGEGPTPTRSVTDTVCPTVVWETPTDQAAMVVIDTVPGGLFSSDPSNTSLKADYITLNQRFDETKAKKWIETDEGKKWRGNAKIAVLHKIAIVLKSKDK